MEKILITGGAGFIPSSLAEKLLNTGKYQVVLVDNFLTGKKQNIPEHPNCYFVKCDVNNYEDISAVMTYNHFDYVFHYAAVVGVKRTLEHPIMVLEDINGIKNILKLSKNTQVKRVFFSSSSEVYGEPVALPQHEQHTPLNSRLPYAVVKNLGEAFCKSYFQEFGLNYTIFRFFNTYGPKQSEDFVISKFMKFALNNQDITVYGDGSQSRTFCYIDDNLDFTLKVLEEGKLINEVINVGNEIPISIYNLAQLIIEVTGSSSKIIHLPPLKDGDMTKRLPDNSKMKTLLGRELLDLKSGLLKLIESNLFEHASHLKEQ